MWSTILCTDVIGIDYLFNSRNLNQLFFIENGILTQISTDIRKNMYLVPENVWNADKHRGCGEVHVVGTCT